MKLEVGKRYVLRNGIVTGPLKHDGQDEISFPFYDPNRRKITTDNYWRKDGSFSTSREPDSVFDIVSEYVEPEPKEPPVGERYITAMQENELRWKWMVPDKPGLWAYGGGYQEESPTFDSCYLVKDEDDIQSYSTLKSWTCFIMDAPSIKPPLKSVIKRLWIKSAESTDIMNDRGKSMFPFEVKWLLESESSCSSGWISTNKTKEFTE